MTTHYHANLQHQALCHKMLIADLDVLTNGNNIKRDNGVVANYNTGLNCSLVFQKSRCLHQLKSQNYFTN